MGEKTVKLIHILMAVLAAVLCLCFAVLIGVVIHRHTHLQTGSPPEIPLTSDDLAHTPNRAAQIIKVILCIAFALIGGLVAVVLIEEQKNKEGIAKV